MGEENKTKESKWPGFVIIIFCALVAIFIPRHTWWGTLIGWLAALWIVVTVMYLWRSFRK